MRQNKKKRSGHWRELLDQFSELQIGVLGDLILDIYLFSQASRISREAPVLVVKYEGRQFYAGGAGNTAANLAALGAKVHFFGRVGNDPEGERLCNLLSQSGIDTSGIVVDVGRTTTKMRILAGDIHTTKHQILRIDYEPEQVPSDSLYQQLGGLLQNAAKQMDGWVVADYGYEIACPALYHRLWEHRPRGPIVVDSRKQITAFAGATLLKPNEEEALGAMGLSTASEEKLVSVGRWLRGRAGVQAVLITRGNKGMLLIEKGRPADWIPICGSEDIVDVSGAGDTTASAATMALSVGASFRQAARIANCAASVVVMKRGTAVCALQELYQTLEKCQINDPVR